MVPKPCVVAFCTKKGTIHFPKDESRRAKWIQAIEHVKPGLSIRNYSRICSDHFKTSDYVTTTSALLQPDKARRSLRKTAVPSKFPWKPDLCDDPPKSQECDLTVNKKSIKHTYSRGPQNITLLEKPLLHLDTSENNSVDPLDLPTDEHFTSDPENILETVNDCNRDNSLACDEPETGVKQLENSTKDYPSDAKPITVLEKSVQTENYYCQWCSLLQS